MSGLGAHFTVSSSPAVGNFYDNDPVPVEDPMDVKLSALHQKMELQSKESAKKISELVEQNKLLNQSMQDFMQKPVKRNPDVEHQVRQSDTIPRNEDGSYDWSSYWDMDTSTQTSTGEDMNPEDISRLVDQKVAEKTEQQATVIQRAKSAEQDLIAQFQSNETDLHPYANQVVELWKNLAAKQDPRFFQENPEEAMKAQYDETIKLAKQLFLVNGAPKQQKKQSYSGFPGGGQGRDYEDVAPADPAMHGMDLPNDVRTEDRRHDDMEDYIRNRKRAQQQRTGYFAIPGQG